MAQVAAFLVLAMAAGVMPLGGQTSLSIYSDGRVVVRRTLPQPLQKGRNTFTLKLEGLDGATLFSPDTAVAVVSAVVRPATDPEAALAAAVAQTLSFVRPRTGGGADTVRATVVRSDPPQYRLPDGRYLLSQPGEPLFPAELVRTGPEAAMAVEATQARPRTELAYVADGAARWEAVYHVVLLGAKCQVSGAATITSQSLRADSAEVQLVAGSISRARAAALRPQLMLRGAMKVAGVEEINVAPSEESVGETHVYQLPGKVSLEPGTPARAPPIPRSSSSRVPCRGAASSPSRRATRIAYRCRCGTRSSVAAARRSATGRCPEERSSCIRPTPPAASSSWGKRGASTRRRGATCGSNRAMPSTSPLSGCRRTTRKSSWRPPSEGWRRASGSPRPTRSRSRTRSLRP